MTDTNAAGDQAVAATDGADAAPILPAGAADPGNDAGRAVDWSVLRDAATAAMRRAYAPYSSFPVGAAALTDDGRVVSGCNVENASYGVTLCAECSLVSQLHMTGGGKLVAFTCVDGDGATLMPCGRCRQLLFEHSAEGMLLETVSGIRTIDEVLPDAFGPRTLATYQEEH
ncbi:cytidine deaminase [Curtobacterium sp. Csp1]|uniref:Cytidine deaminase n=1 Tax=Curtobacterium citreum TaxID=2036 RepID=A0ABT2HHQ2_9MICO|nr:MULTISPECIES: cytidine deaminase [Curtobacterium]MCS6522683.1 cytidine deaminase [Curtobacterium citreum]QKS13840.1 cytidine deaminase [Curtobacterium sp. csp3]QKS20884.1 cytidine deaminase [Curtobacterium sp. Csp1]RDI00110.1 cytidine deaminase [Curtobacterium sp. AG1037]TQJ28591.1 cytidine deaminase [Curtobacterium citreum]